ncbi:MAG: ABC transporter permease [Chloroflexi bacterium]|nr:ABC transporter permease [Chloroflexota bacterium]HLG51594.1 FtsX-like permease family protein [Chloroflexota bacterium]
MFSYAIANAFRRWGISLLAIAGVGLGTMLMTVLMSLNAGLHTRLAGTSHLAGEIIVAAADAPLGGALAGGSPLSLAMAQTIGQLPHVVAVEPRAVAAIPTTALASVLPTGVPFIGVDLGDPGSPAVTPPGDLLEGRGARAPNEIVVGAQVNAALRQLGQGDLHPGNVVKIYKLKTREEEDLTVVGVFETHDALTDGVIYGDVQVARDLLGLDSDKATALDVEVDDASNASAVARAIADRLQGTQPPIQTSLPGRGLAELSGAMGLLDEFLLAGSLVAAGAGGMSIFIIMMMSVTERRREFGILKAAGWSNRDVRLAVLIESLILSVFGADAGFALGALAVALLRRLIGTDVVVITPTLIAEVAAFTLVVGGIGGIVPALRAARSRPIEMLRGGY